MPVNRAWPLFCLYRVEAYAILARDGGWRVRCGARVACSPFGGGIRMETGLPFCHAGWFGKVVVTFRARLRLWGAASVNI